MKKIVVNGVATEAAVGGVFRLPGDFDPDAQYVASVPGLGHRAEVPIQSAARHLASGAVYVATDTRFVAHPGMARLLPAPTNTYVTLAMQYDKDEQGWFGAVSDDGLRLYTTDIHSTPEECAETLREFCETYNMPYDWRDGGAE